MMFGASLFLSYDLITEFLRHHDETNLRPKFIDHMLAFMIIGTVTGFVGLNTFHGAFQGFLLSTFALGPITYWCKLMGMEQFGFYRPVNILYQDDITPEEVERIRMEDEVEIMAHNMSTKPGYGLIHKGRSAHGLGI